MKIGDTVKLARDDFQDLGRLLGSTGKIIAGGCKRNKKVQWLVSLGRGIDIHVFENDLDIVTEL